MQSKDGGWAAFDVDNNLTLLSEVPFADHNAMLDPTCPDITGRVLEALIAMGLEPSHPAIRRGVAYLKRAQQEDGSWWGRWGVCYIYGTFLALRGLAAAGESDREAYILRAGEWLRSIQNSDGGWGESCAAYDEGTYVAAPSTPSQTAWAILGLIAGGDTTSISVMDGIGHLVETQQDDGSWREDLATGTGFPRVFYLSYHMYRNSFPLLALNIFSRPGREPMNAGYIRFIAFTRAIVPTMKPVLVTGASGFIGWHVARKLIERGILCAPSHGPEVTSASYRLKPSRAICATGLRSTPLSPGAARYSMSRPIIACGRRIPPNCINPM